MDMAQRVQTKLEKILIRLKVLKIIHHYELKINFCQIEDNMKGNLKIVDSVLKKCLKKIVSKPKRAEIRNVILEVVRKKNLNYVSDGSLRDSEPENPAEYETSKPPFFSTDRKTVIKETPKEYHCERCGKTFPNTWKWKSHEETHSWTFFTCEKCSRKFPTIEELDRHRLHHGRPDRAPAEVTHSTPLKSFDNSKSVDDGRGEEELKYRESIRQKVTKVTHLTPLKSFENSKNVDDGRGEEELKSRESIRQKVTKVTHLTPLKSFDNSKSVDDGRGEEELKSRESSRQKVTNTKTEKNGRAPHSYVCHCGKIFKLRKSLKKHENLKHAETKTEFRCSYCQKSYFEKSKLNRHILSHATTSHHKCSQCSKQFARSDALRRHVMAAHDRIKNFACSFCKKTFTLKYNRDVHEENVHKTRNNWLQCEHCGQKFKTKITLKSHMEIHSGKPISCSLCNKVFVKKINYKNHMKKRHFGVSPYQNLLDSVSREEMISES